MDTYDDNTSEQGVNWLMEEGDDARERYFVKSLERGLSVIQSFSAERERQSMAEVAEATGMTRAAARRFMLTLVDLDFMRTDGRYFSLTPKVLELGYSYLASAPLAATVQPHLEDLIEMVRADTEMSVLDSGVAVLDGSDMVYIAHAQAVSLFTLNVATGSRFPTWITSTGRVLLAGMENDKLNEYLKPVRFTPYTEKTVTTHSSLLTRIAKVRERGWSVVDQEFDDRLCAYAVPLHDQARRPIAALSVSVMHNESLRARYEKDLVSLMVKVASRIEGDLRLRGHNDNLRGLSPAG